MKQNQTSLPKKPPFCYIYIYENTAAAAVPPPAQAIVARNSFPMGSDQRKSAYCGIASYGYGRHTGVLRSYYGSLTVV